MLPTAAAAHQRFSFAKKPDAKLVLAELRNKLTPRGQVSVVDKTEGGFSQLSPVEQFPPATESRETHQEPHLEHSREILCEESRFGTSIA